jgi:hypothetical protein
MVMNGALLARLTATLTGRITDTSGGVIADARVEARNPGANMGYGGETNRMGSTAFPNFSRNIRVISSNGAQEKTKPSGEAVIKSVITRYLQRR